MTHTTFAPLARTVTVVLPTKDEKANVAPFLSSLPADLPLIVVDASRDDTAELILRLRPRLTTVVRNHGNITFARQLGVELARTPWVLCTDADVAFTPEYFGRLAERRIPADLGALFGTKSSSTMHRTYHRVFRLGQGLCALAGIPAGSGSNMLVSRDALACAGGFDLDLPCNEDSELLWRIRRSGRRVVFAPELEVIARDHRRLARGATRKMVHSVARCALLYSGLMPRRFRGADWGYWS